MGWDSSRTRLSPSQASSSSTLDLASNPEFSEVSIIASKTLATPSLVCELLLDCDSRNLAVVVMVRAGGLA